LDQAEAQTAGNDDDAYPPRSAATAQASLDPTSTHASATRRGRILVAEDNSTNQRVAQLILESRGHRVSIVNNGEAALDALEQGGFDIALFDLSMPGVSGLEALKVYRFTASKPIPVLILSANVTREAINECQQAGAAEFIAKPLRASILLNAIDRHLVEIPATGAVAIDESAFVQQAPRNDSAEVDYSVLQDLALLSKDPTFVDRLIDGYRTDLERLLPEILDGISRQDFDAVRDAAHALKGGSASVGALRLAAIATKLNDADNRTMVEYAADWGSELRYAAQVTIAKLREHSASHQSKRSLQG
jgi:two-component system sensor histidine kinase RpfC